MAKPVKVNWPSVTKDEEELGPKKEIKPNPLWLEIYEQIYALHMKKAADYGRGEDPLANVRSAKEFGVSNWVGVAMRMNDKMHRLKTFAQKGFLENESVEDSLLDIANYAIIALALFREETKEKT